MILQYIRLQAVCSSVQRKEQKNDEMESIDEV